VYFHTNAGGWYVINFERNQMRMANSVKGSFEHSLALDSKRNKIYELGRKTSGGGDPSRFKIIDLDSPTLPVTEVATSGDRTGMNTRNPGVAFHPLADRVVLWSGGTAVYTLDPDTRVWIKQPLPATNTAIPSAITAAGGVYGRFQYVPAYDVFVAVNSTDESVYIYKLDHATVGQEAASTTAYRNVSITAAPNPFRSHTTIVIQGSTFSQLKVFDLAGKMVTTLSNAAETKTNSRFAWNTKNHPAGIYLIQVRAGDAKITKRLFLMK